MCASEHKCVLPETSFLFMCLILCTLPHASSQSVGVAPLGQTGVECRISLFRTAACSYVTPLLAPMMGQSEGVMIQARPRGIKKRPLASLSSETSFSAESSQSSHAQFSHSTLPFLAQGWLKCRAQASNSSVELRVALSNR